MGWEIVGVGFLGGRVVQPEKGGLWGRILVEYSAIGSTLQKQPVSPFGKLCHLIQNSLR